VTAAVDVVVHLVRESGGARRLRDIQGADRRVGRLRPLDELLIHQLGDERCGRS
jgi:hypothetical protein